MKNEISRLIKIQKTLEKEQQNNPCDSFLNQAIIHLGIAIKNMGNIGGVLKGEVLLDD